MPTLAPDPRSTGTNPCPCCGVFVCCCAGGTIKVPNTLYATISNMSNCGSVTGTFPITFVPTDPTTVGYWMGSGGSFNGNTVTLVLACSNADGREPPVPAGYTTCSAGFCGWGLSDSVGSCIAPLGNRCWLPQGTVSCSPFMLTFMASGSAACGCLPFSSAYRIVILDHP